LHDYVLTFVFDSLIFVKIATAARIIVIAMADKNKNQGFVCALVKLAKLSW